MKILRMALILLLLPGCDSGGGGSSDGGTPRLPQDDPDPDALLLPPGSQEQFQNYLINGLEQWAGLSENSSAVRSLLVTNGAPGMDSGLDVVSVLAGQAVATDAIAPSASPPSGISETNVIVSGVDEVDVARYDGEFVYLANGSHLQIIRTRDGAPGEIVSTLDLSSPDAVSSSRGLYHFESGAESRLVNIRAQQYFYALGMTIDLVYRPWIWVNHFGVDFIDVSTPENPGLTERMEIDGAYVNSRRVGGTLYVVSQFTPQPEGVVPFAETTSDKRANRNLIENLDVENLLPRVTFSDGSSVALVSSSECLVPNSQGDNQIYSPVITTVTAFDIHDPANFNSLCMAESVDGTFVSNDAIYLSAYSPIITQYDTYYDSTIIHKISIGGSRPQYVGSGTVPGTFWGDPAFLMGEHDGHLTAITSTWDTGQAVHRLSILGPSGKAFELKVLGHIPSANRPRPIGKEGEQIYASRIMGNRAYVVTFKKIDPVYVIDLANPADPRILGEVEIPGFSSYLHPVSDDLVVGVGKDGDDQGSFAWFQGVSVRLFDVSNPGAIEVVADLGIGRRPSDTPVRWDHHAFTILGDNGIDYIAIPVNVYGAHVPEVPDQPSYYYPWTENALYLFVLNEAQKSLTFAGKVIAQDETTGQRSQPGCCSWNDRAFLNGDAIHYLSGTRLITASWTNPVASANLFIPTLFSDAVQANCSTDVQPGIAVYANDRATGDWICATWSVDGYTGTYPDGSCSYYWNVIGLDSTTSPAPAGTGSPLFETPGVYALTVNADGYQPWHTTDVRVQKDQCHVGTVYVTAPMTHE